MLICVHGNIGSGKTTFLKNNYKDFIKFEENLEEWNIYFKKYYEAMNVKGNLTLS